MKELFDELQRRLDSFDVIDLSHTIERGMPKYPTHPQIVIDPVCTHEHDGYFNQCLVMGEHTGSHMDAPAHTVSSMPDSTIDTVSPTAVCGQAVVYDLGGLGLGAGELVTAADIIALEAKMGDAAGAGEIAVFNFHWEKYWRCDGAWQYYAKNEPGFAKDAVELFRDRAVKAVAFDTMSADMPVKDGVEYPSTGHYTDWLPRGILIVEELKNLDLLPTRCFLVGIPLKIKHGSGSPIRPIALVPRKA